MTCSLVLKSIWYYLILTFVCLFYCNASWVVFYAFIHLYFLSYLGTLDAPRKGHDVGAETKDGAWWIHPEDGRTKQVPDGRCLPSEHHLTNTDLVLDPRQAPEHFKPPIFYKISLESFMFDALGDKSWIETTQCIELPCPDIYTFNPV